MRIGIIGASGNIGRRATQEAIDRGHEVIGYSRDPEQARHAGLAIEWKAMDVLDPVSVSAGIARLDVVVSLFQPGNASRDLADTLAQSIADPGAYAIAARSLLKALERYPRTRLIVVGGAGSLEIAPGRVGADSSDLPEQLEAIGLPGDYAVAVRGHREALDLLRLSNRLWTYFSPAAEIYAGDRTGRFRLGGDQMIFDAAGRSHISYEDFAIALIDEIELPRHVQRRFTIGY
jgi:uncharacterized protein